MLIALMDFFLKKRATKKFVGQYQIEKTCVNASKTQPPI